MGKYKKLILNAIIFGMGNLSVKFVQFLVMPILTTYLTVDEYGINEILATVLELAIPVITLGIGESMFRFALQKETSQEEVITNGLIVVAVGLITAVVAVPIAYFIVPQTYVILLLPLMILNALKKQFAEFTRGRGKTIVYSVAGIFESIVFLAVAAVFLIYLKWGIEGYLFAMMIGSFSAILYYIIVANPIKYIDRKAVSISKMKEMVRFSLPNVPNMVSWWIVQVSSKYILLAMSGLTITSMYMASTKIPALINVVSTIFLQAWSLSSAEESEDKNQESRNEFYSRVFRYYNFAILLMTCVIIALTPYISKFLLRGEFYEAWSYSPVLIVSGGLGCFSSFFGAFYSAFYRTKTAMTTTLLGAFCNIAISASLIPFIGVYGAIVGNLIGYMAIVISRILTTRKYVKVEAPWIKICVVFVLILGQAIIYTLEIEYAYLVSIAVGIIMIALYVREIKELIKLVCNMFKKLRKKVI